MQKFPKFIRIFLISLLVVSLVGCTTKIGSFSAISTNNVRGLEYSGKNRDEIIQVSEKSCTHRIYLTRVVMGVVTLGVGWFMPEFDLTFGDSEQDRLNNAVDNAIKSGKSKGVFDGDLLTNAVIKQKNLIIPLLYGYKCYIADGDLVSSVTRTDGFLDRKKKDQVKEVK